MSTRPIPARALAMLACPVCYQTLVSAPIGRAVHCLGCGRAYPVIDGIPVLLADRATSDDEEA